MKTLFLLYVEFFKIGIFSIGGGYATLPFLFHMAQHYGWFSAYELTQMLAISSITPGPVGLNVATFAGFKTAGIIGSITATVAIMVPSFIFVIFISKMLKKFKDSSYINAALYALRPATAAMIGAVALRLFMKSVVINHHLFKENICNAIDIKALFLLILLFVISFKLKRDPLIYLVFGAVAGILFNLNHLF